MSWTTKATIFLGAAGLGIAAISYTEPRTFQQQDQQRLQEQHEQWAEQDQNNRERARDNGQRDAEAEHARRRQPSEHRSPPRIRVRFP